MGTCASSNAVDGNDGVTYDNDPSTPFSSFQLELWMDITKYLRASDVMNLRLASLGIPGAVTLNPRLTSHLTLNLDKCPYLDWIWTKSSDHEQLARKWCSLEGMVDFPKDISNEELELFISRGYLNETKRVSFARCRKLTVESFELLKGLGCAVEFIEVSLPTSITDNELRKANRYVNVHRLVCIGTSSLTNSGYGALGELRTLTELHFLHCKNLTSLAFLAKLSCLQKLHIDGMLNVENTSLLTPVVDDDVLSTIVGIPLRSLVIATRLDISGIGLVQISHLRSLESLALERGAGESLTDSVLKVLCGLAKIRKLRITDSENITDLGLSYLQRLSRITSLELGGSNFTDESARQISKVTGLKSLCLIGWEKMTEKGLCYLAKLKSLESLTLRCSTQISDSGIEQLRRFKSLRDLQLSNECGITSAGKARLSKNGVRVKLT